MSRGQTVARWCAVAAVSILAVQVVRWWAGAPVVFDGVSMLAVVALAVAMVAGFREVVGDE